jgi:hypothetical protein
MARLMPNPLGDLERSLGGLNEQLEALQLLPEIRDQLIEVNANLTTMCQALATMQPQPAVAADVDRSGNMRRR